MEMRRNCNLDDGGVLAPFFFAQQSRLPDASSVQPSVDPIASAAWPVPSGERGVSGGTPQHETIPWLVNPQAQSDAAATALYEAAGTCIPLARGPQHTIDPLETPHVKSAPTATCSNFPGGGV
jgi:hypothetical protein